MLIAAWLMACGGGSEPLRPRVEAAVERAAAWQLAWEGPLRFDSRLAAHAVREHVRTPATAAVVAKADGAVDDPDHALMILLDPDAKLPAEAITGWAPPVEGAERVNVNRVVGEAAHCAEHGLRPEALAYLCGPMRDEGGFHTTHAAWALALAKQRGCVPEACTDSLVEELVRHQPAPEKVSTTLEVDLYAERLLMVQLLGSEAPEAWVEGLLGLQAQDGSFHLGDDVQVDYLPYHATMVGSWALAEWLQRE